jgi:hypothetical protein
MLVILVIVSPVDRAELIGDRVPNIYWYLQCEGYRQLD